MKELTPLERLAWKQRGELGEPFDPYTAEERKLLQGLQRRQRDLEREAEALHRALVARLARDGEANPALRRLGAALELESMTRLEIHPV